MLEVIPQLEDPDDSSKRRGQSVKVRVRRYITGLGSFRSGSSKSYSYNVGLGRKTTSFPKRTRNIPKSSSDSAVVRPKSQFAEGVDGFEELRKLIKQGSDICRDIASVIADRCTLEAQYSKGLQKLGAKLAKICLGSQGTTVSAWETVAEEMNAESELHSKIGESLQEDIYKPLKNMCDNHTKVRKPIELAVEKASRSLSDQRLEEQKYKVKSFQNAADMESLHTQIIELRMSSAKKSPEKELAKAEKKLTVLKEQVRKSGKQYYSCSLAAERSRQDWEATNFKSSGQLQQLEEERLKELHKYLKLYKIALEKIPPQLTATCERLSEAVQCIDFSKDLRRIIDGQTRGSGQPEQILFESYAEYLDHPMEKERRRQNLTLFLYYLSQDIDVEQKARAGLEKLADAYHTRPDYADQDAVDDTKLKIKQTHSMLNFLDASHYKLSKTLSSINGQDIPSYKFSSYMEETKDKSGLPLTTLRVPPHLVVEGFSMVDFCARGRADGSHDSHNDSSLYENSVDQSDTGSHYDDDFDTYDELDGTISSAKVNCQCEVLYDFNSSQSEELTVRQGDIINVIEKRGDGWWRGQLRGAVGLFPGSYVKEKT